MLKNTQKSIFLRNNITLDQHTLQQIKSEQTLADSCEAPHTAQGELDGQRQEVTEGRKLSEELFTMER